jgi:hypothetical protein
MNYLEEDSSLFKLVKQVVLEARQRAYRSNNAILLQMYWEIGKLIVEDEQAGNPKAAYG